MKILTLLTLMAAVYFVARGDQHAGSASVIAADGRVWDNARIDWTLAGDLQLSERNWSPNRNASGKDDLIFPYDRFLVSRGFCLGFHRRSNRLRNLHSRRFGSTAGPEVKDRFGDLKFILRWNDEPP